MERELVTSRANPLLARVRKLNSRRAFRREENAFAAEGPKLLGEALRWGAELEAVIAAPGVSLPELPRGVRVVEVPDGLLASIADTETPQGVVFTCTLPDTALPDRLEKGRYLVLDGVQDRPAGEALDGLHAPPLERRRLDGTGVDRPSVQNHAARAAGVGVTAALGPCQAQLFPQDVQPMIEPLLELLKKAVASRNAYANFHFLFGLLNCFIHSILRHIPALHFGLKCFVSVSGQNISPRVIQGNIIAPVRTAVT